MKATCLLLILVISAPARADVVLDWNEETLAAIQRTAAPPPVAARALAMTHVAIYDAVNSIAPSHQSFQVYSKTSPTTSLEAAAAQAAFRVLQQLFPSEQVRLESALAGSLAHVPNGPDKTAGIRLGETVAGKVIAWRKDDGSRRSVPHTPGTQPGQWRPTPPDFKMALLPQWSSVTPFGISYASQFRPALPPDLASAEYAKDVEEVRTLGAQTNDMRTADQTQIAYFWADGRGTVTPPGHWNRIAQTVASSAGLSAHENARLFALLNIALADAAIVCWDMKFTCNLWRPITAIQEADTDGNDRTTRDPNWRPLLDTPPFPSCTSGHSTFSGAAAQVLALYFGRDKMPFTDTSGALRATRSYSSFSQAAEEAGRSRIYGGIHFGFDNWPALQSGSAVGRYIFARYMRPLSASTNEGLAVRTANRPQSGRGWVSGTGSRADSHATSARPHVTSYSGSSLSPVTYCCYPPTTYTSPTFTYAGNSFVTQFPQTPALYCDPVVGQYAAVTASPPSEVTYYYLTGW